MCQQRMQDCPFQLSETGNRERTGRTLQKGTSIMDNNFRPEDSAAMAAPHVNKEIWGSMTAQTRGNDIENQCMKTNVCLPF